MIKSRQALSSQFNCSSNDDADEVCDICRSGDSCPEDVIIFCDSCSVPVHASCYTITSIPKNDEPWFCYPCSKGFQTSKMACALCNHSNGAFKRTSVDEGTWVHGLCANWIPELCEETDEKPEFGPLVRMDLLLKDRSRLKCSECGGKKGCVQCSHARCLAAIHSHCMLKRDSDFSWRVIEGKLKSGLSYYRREVYCARHIDDVGLPMKASDELLIQVDPKSKYEWNDEYVPVLKAQYRNDPAYADLHRGTPQKVRNSREDANLSSPCSGSRRSREQPSPAASRTLTAEGRNIPMKRPRASILQSLVSSAREKVPSSSGGSAAAGRTGGVEQQQPRLGDKRAPSSRPSSSLLSVSTAPAVVKKPATTRQLIARDNASVTSGDETPMSVSSRSCVAEGKAGTAFSSAYFNSNSNTQSNSTKKMSTPTLQQSTDASDEPETPPHKVRTNKAANSSVRSASSAESIELYGSRAAGHESAGVVANLTQAKGGNKRKRSDGRNSDHSSTMVPTETQTPESMLSLSLDAHTIAQLQRALLNLSAEHSSTSGAQANTSTTIDEELSSTLQVDLEKHKQLNQALRAERDALQQQNLCLLARVGKLEERRVRRKARKHQRRQSSPSGAEGK